MNYIELACFGRQGDHAVVGPDISILREAVTACMRAVASIGLEVYVITYGARFLAIEGYKGSPASVPEIDKFALGIALISSNIGYASNGTRP